MVFEGVAEQLFKKQVKYSKGRYWIDVPFSEKERMHWIGSMHTALLDNPMYRKFGLDYYLETYRNSKLYGHVFGSKITSLVKTKRLIAPMMTLIVKQFGWGKIEAIKTDYKGNWMTFNFYDLPLAREVSKIYGFQKMPIDYITGGLISGAAEQLIKRKFITMEVSCAAMGDKVCSFETLSIENFKKRMEKIKNKEYKALLKKILEMEERTDFFKDVKELIKGKKQNANQNEQNFLKREGIN